MRKITTTFLVALLTLSVGFGTVAAKPKDDNPGKGKDNGATVVHISENGSTAPVGDWSCSGVYVQNNNHARVNIECEIAVVGSYSGTYTSGIDSVPDWLSGVGSAYKDRAMSLVKLAGVSPDDVSWQIVVTPNGDGSGTVEAVAILK